ncbi:hypothetical protein FSARC_5327 [Fusarium sarcochroum]|uniref:Uncharacterized protein n=1 Tax=Fusarium sarcochroum TaxID=1208366 RepID=A0A8H4XAI6_9HYPO|nr:hypothetical protein FSARC_5327 [Fusarium sarcochroum]
MVSTITSVSLEISNFNLAVPSPRACFNSVAEASSCNNDSGRRWKHGNPSTYLIDGGMWNACKESRLVIGHNFDWKHWCKERRDNRNHFRFVLKGDEVSVPVTVRFDNNELEDQYFTMLPHHDLFVLQFEDSEAAFGPHVIYGYSCRPHLYSALKHLRIRHLGIEYDPSWGVKIKNGKNHHARDQFLEGISAVMDSFENVYIIDYNLTRRPLDTSRYQEPTNQERATFYANDRRFVEVKCDRDRSSLGYWQCVQEKAGDSVFRTSTDFIMKARAYWKGGRHHLLPRSGEGLKLLGWEMLEHSS